MWDVGVWGSLSVEGRLTFLASSVALASTSNSSSDRLELRPL